MTLLSEEAFAQPDNLWITGNPDVMPRFEKGTIELFNDISQNFRFDETDALNEISGDAILTFVIDTAGSVSQVEIRKGVSPSINKELIRILTGMRGWIPGRAEGRWVNSKYSLALMIRAADKVIEPVFR